MHTEGEPLRVITGGFPEIKGNSVLDKRRYVKENLDHLRTALMFEPRGHADMYGCLVTPPFSPGADFGVIFMHNEGYSTMCGHATIAIAKLAVIEKWIKFDPAQAEIEVKIDAPCGPLTAWVAMKAGLPQTVRFHNVPSFVSTLDAKIEVPGLGEITYDLAYGGAFYAFVNAADVGLSCEAKDYNALIQKGMQIKKAVMQVGVPVKHPIEEDLSFLYGTIFLGESLSPENHSRNVCIFAEGEVDRCPTGSGVSARLAIHHARKELAVGQDFKVESIIGTVFRGRVVEQVSYHGLDAIIPEVEGNAFITGRHQFYIDPEDPLKDGFIFR